MKLSRGCDHGAYALKEHLKDYLTGQGHEVVDCGTYSTDSCDYPIFARAAAEQVASGQCERGIVLCTTGIGVSMVANKVKGVRCALCRDLLSAQLTRQHNNANMLALAGTSAGWAWSWTLSRVKLCDVNRKAEAALNIRAASAFVLRL